MPKSIMNFIQEGMSVPLTKIAAGYSPVGMIADQVLPVVPHIVSSGKVPVFGKEAFQRHKTLRSPGAESNRAPAGTGSWVTFHCDEHDIAIPLDQRELEEAARLPQIAGPLFDMQNRARNRAQWNLAVEREYRVATLCQTAGTYASGHSVTLTTAWDETGGAPLSDIETGREKVRSSIGRYPNTLILGASAYETLKFHDDYTGKMKLSEDKVVRPDLIAKMHDLDNVLIGMGVEVNGDGTFTDLWGDNAILCYIPKTKTPALDEPAFGYTIRPMNAKTFPYVDIFTEEGGKIVNVRCTDCYDHTVLMPGAGYLIADCKG